jgi:hypothetical protein
MEDPTATAAGHATEDRTDHDPRIAVDRVAEMPVETTVAGGTIPATEGVAVMAQQIPGPAVATPAALDLTRRTGSLAKIARYAFTHPNGMPVPQLMMQNRIRSQLSPHRPNRRRRRIRRLSGCANSKP